MASIVDERNGRRRIEFGPAGKRKRIRLGKVDHKHAEAFGRRVEKMLAANALGEALDRETAEWLATLADEVHARIAATELVRPRSRQNLTLKAFLDELFATLAVKPNTMLNYSKARNCL
jgi:hypothetical protein